MPEGAWQASSMPGGRSIFEGALLLGVCKAETFYCFNLQTLMETPQTHPRRVWLLSGLGELEASLRVSS